MYSETKNEIKFYISRLIIVGGFFICLAVGLSWWNSQIMEEENHLTCDELKPQMETQTRQIINREHVQSLYMVKCMPEVEKP